MGTQVFWDILKGCVILLIILIAYIYLTGDIDDDNN
jgi:hypothetical protein